MARRVNMDWVASARGSLDTAGFLSEIGDHRSARNSVRVAVSYLAEALGASVEERAQIRRILEGIRGEVDAEQAPVSEARRRAS